MAANGRTIHLLIRKLRRIIYTHKLISNTRKYAHFFYECLKILFFQASMPILVLLQNVKNGNIILTIKSFFSIVFQHIWLIFFSQVQFKIMLLLRIFNDPDIFARSGFKKKPGPDSKKNIIV